MEIDDYIKYFNEMSAFTLGCDCYKTSSINAELAGLLQELKHRRENKGHMAFYPDYYGKGKGVWICTRCGREKGTNEDMNANYCSVCGALLDKRWEEKE